MNWNMNIILNMYLHGSINPLSEHDKLFYVREPQVITFYHRQKTIPRTRWVQHALRNILKSNLQLQTGHHLSPDRANLHSLSNQPPQSTNPFPIPHADKNIFVNFRHSNQQNKFSMHLSSSCWNEQTMVSKSPSALENGVS